MPKRTKTHRYGDIDEKARSPSSKCERSACPRIGSDSNAVPRRENATVKYVDDRSSDEIDTFLTDEYEGGKKSKKSKSKKRKSKKRKSKKRKSKKRKSKNRKIKNIAIQSIFI